MFLGCGWLGGRCVAIAARIQFKNLGGRTQSDTPLAALGQWISGEIGGFCELRSGLQGGANLGEKLIDLKGLKQDGVEAVLAGAHDRMVRVVAEAGH